VTTDAETPVGGAEQDDPPPAIARHRPVRARDADAASASTLNRPRQPWYRTGLGALAIVLALVGIALVVARRYLPTMRTADSAALQVVARTGVTPRHSVALVRLGRRLVLVGVSGDRMRRLSEVTDPLEIAEILAHTGAAATRGFDRFLVEEASAYGAPGGPESKTDPASAAVSPEVAGAMARRDRQRLPALANLKSRLQALRST
jgi:flagellar biogenesis protein FliO